MTRHKTISDEELLAVARKVFSEQGHAASTRMIAQEAGISEGVLFQRFGNKEELFFASMVPRGPDLETLLGPQPPKEAAPTFLRNVLSRMSSYFSEVIPLSLHIHTHPSAKSSHIKQVQHTLVQIQKELEARIVWYEQQKIIRRSTAERTSQLLVSLAHNWAFSHNVPTSRSSSGQRIKELEEMAEIVWRGIAR